jgi:hypothetical protein
MRNVSNLVKTLLLERTFVAFYTVEIPKVSLYINTSGRDLTLSNGTTYLGNHSLISLEPPRLSSVVDRSPYKLSFADPNLQLKQIFDSKITANEVIVRIGFFNAKDTSVTGSDGISVNSMNPFLNILDTVIVYRGIIDIQNYELDINNYSAIASLECASPVAGLDQVNSIFTSRDSIYQLRSDDTSFDNVFVNSGSRTLLWGKV